MTALASRVSYRQTFLRRHIQNELHPQIQSDGRVREEVLALDNLRYRLRQAFPGLSDEVIRSAVTLHDFFYGGDRGVGTSSDIRLYLEVPVRTIASAQPRIASSQEEGQLAWRELSHLLRDESVAPRGVVLRARSGAGKTTAMLKAFHDCLHSADGSPLLAGRLPCYLRDLTATAPPIAEALREGGAGSGLVEGLLLHAAGWPEAKPEVVQDWLRWSDPLMIFLDLNTAAEEVALLLSQALPAFQRAWAKQGHRCVVAYRSFGQDTVYSNLRDLGGFAFYDLQPLPYSLARGYLEHLAAYETWLRERLTKQTGMSAVGTAPEYDLERLERLARQHVRGTDGVLSTPLLVHLFSLLRGPQQRRVHCLADLYHEVVEEYLDREYGPLEGRPRIIDAPLAVAAQPELTSGSSFGTAEGRFRLKTALVRIALAVLGQPSGEGGPATRLLPLGKTASDRVLDTLLERPGDLPYWWQTDKEWHAGAYFHEPYSPAERVAIRRLSLLRLDGSAYAFLHDSFLYWFAALGLRCPRTPEPDLSPLGREGMEKEPWFGMATRRMHANPEAWRLPAEFLGGMLTWEELAVLIREVLAIPPRLGWPDVLLNLARGRRRPDGKDDALLADVERALLHKWPGVFGKSGEDTALVSEVYHYLRDATNNSVELGQWIDQCRRLLLKRGPSWLYSQGPTVWPLPIMRAHQGPVTCVAVMDDGCVISGGEDGLVILWNPSAGDRKVLHQHEESVLALAVSADGQVIVSGGADHCVRRTVQGVPDRVPLCQHKEDIYAVAASADGRVIVSGDKSVLLTNLFGGDNCLRRAVDGIPDSQPLYAHEYGVNSTAVSADGRVIVSGGAHDCRVCRTVGDVPDQAPLYRHKYEVTAVGVSADGRIIVSSGGRDNSVRRAVDSIPDPEPIYHHQDSVHIVAISADGRVIVSGGADKCVRRAVDGVADAEPLYQHEGEVTSVAVSADGRVIVSGSADHCVRRAVDGVADPNPLHKHEGKVLAVAVSKDGRFIVSGGVDHCVRLAVQGIGVPKSLYEGEEGVKAAAMSADGRVVVRGDWNGCLRLTVDGVYDSVPIYRHEHGISSVAVSADGSVVVSGGADNCIRRAVDAVPDPKPLYFHDEEISTVSLSADGRVVVSGDWDGSLCRAVDGSPDQSPLLKFELPGDQIFEAMFVAMAKMFESTKARQHLRGPYLEDSTASIFLLDHPILVTLSADGRVIVARGFDTVHRIVDGVPDLEPLCQHEYGVYALAVSADGRVIVSGGADKCVRRAVDGVADAEPLYQHEGEVTSVAVSADGRVIVSGSADHCVRRAVDGVAGSELLFQHNARVRAVAVSPDGRIIASGGDDAAIRLWFVAPPRLLIYLCNASVVRLSMATNGQRIFAGVENGEVLTLDLVTPDELSSADLG